MAHFKKGAQGGGREYPLRQNQLFGPWGIGAILPCPDGASVMIAGLEAFPASSGEMEIVSDRRLARYIGVKRLLAPPLNDATVPAVRFPRWLYCPSCGAMHYCKGTSQTLMHCNNPTCKSKRKPTLVPERFIVICDEGHVDDFPVMEWVHGGPVDDPSKHAITRRTRGGSASLGDIEYRCSCGASRSLQSATNEGTLGECGYSCSGSEPWLDRSQGKCNSNVLRVVQRGGTNVWYSDVVSSIYIPDGTDKQLNDFIDSQYQALFDMNSAGEKVFDTFAGTLANQCRYSAEEIKTAFLTRLSEPVESSESEEHYREAEYKTLKSASPLAQENGVFEAKALPSSEYSSRSFKKLIDSVSLISTLKETKALVGFTRLDPEKNEGKSFSERRACLSRNYHDWTLGLQMTGEGIFLAFNQEALDKWKAKPQVKARLAILQKNHNSYERSKGNDKSKKLNPQFVLIHTLSHLLMLELSKVCGYSAASVKERIYCQKYLDGDAPISSMAGLMIYTASDDCEGSLGGLVRAGRPGRFERIFDGAVHSAQWCSSDPVCIESPGQGPGSCNLAACYSCALTPETSCESGNRFLDRALLVGTLSQPSIGIIAGENTELEKQTQSYTGTERTYMLIVDDVPDINDETFAGVCEYAIPELENGERLFLEKLCQISETQKLEKPFPYARLSDGENNAEPTFVWKDKRIALLFGDAPHDFVEAFGEDYLLCRNWTLYTIDDIKSADDFARLIGEQ